MMRWLRWLLEWLFSARYALGMANNKKPKKPAEITPGSVRREQFENPPPREKQTIAASDVGSLEDVLGIVPSPESALSRLPCSPCHHDCKESTGCRLGRELLP